MIKVSEPLSPYLEFGRNDWGRYRQDMPLTLTEAEIEQLRGQNESVSLSEVVDIYLPLSRLLSLYVAATQDLYHVTARFLGHPEPKVPYIIAIAGSVAVGKSTTSRVLQALLTRWPQHPRVALMTTDGYLFNNETLVKKGLMDRKGFPESYDIKALLQFLVVLKAGKPQLKVPVYSHHNYDILSGKYQVVDQPDIVILEGLNVLQVPSISKIVGGVPQIYVSDYIDFSIYVDAEMDVIRDWYIDRFMLFREKASHDKTAFFHQFAAMKEKEAIAFAQDIWLRINQANLIQNILPFKQRARLILEKAKDHSVQKVFLRKL